MKVFDAKTLCKNDKLIIKLKKILKLLRFLKTNAQKIEIVNQKQYK